MAVDVASSSTQGDSLAPLALNNNTEAEHDAIARDATQGCRFLELPAELRNMIAELAVDTDRVIQILPAPQKTLATTRESGEQYVLRNLAKLCPLAQANRQLRSEVLPMALIPSNTFKTTVRDFNFNHIMVFFDHLPDHELDQLFARNKQEGTTRFIIELTFSGEYNVHDRDRHPDLQAWFKRKRGISRPSRVHFEYIPLQLNKFFTLGHVREADWDVFHVAECEALEMTLIKQYLEAKAANL